MPINTGIKLKIPVKDGADNGDGQSDAGYTEMFQAVDEFLRIRISIHCHIDGCACQSEADDDDDRPDDHGGSSFISHPVPSCLMSSAIRPYTIPARKAPTMAAPALPSPSPR